MEEKNSDNVLAVKQTLQGYLKANESNDSLNGTSNNINDEGSESCDIVDNSVSDNFHLTDVLNVKSNMNTNVLLKHEGHINVLNKSDSNNNANEVTSVIPESAKETNELIPSSNAANPDLTNLPKTVQETLLPQEHTRDVKISIEDNLVLTPNLDIDGSTSLSTDTTLLDRKLSQKGKTKRRGSAWTDDETDFLMEVWARHSDSPGKEEFSHNTPVYRLISKAMLEKGYDKSWEQCKTRIHTLKRAYKITQDEIKAGKTNIIYCKHFDKLMILMGDDPVTSPKMLADNLALKRLERDTASKHVQNGSQITPTTPSSTPKRKQTSTDKSVKRQNSGSDKSPVPSSSFSSLHIVQRQDTQPSVVKTSVWHPAVNVQSTALTTSLSNQPQSIYLPPVQYQMPPPPPYQPPPTFSTPQADTPQLLQRPHLQEINNNIAVKTERVEEPLKVTFTSPIIKSGLVQTTQTTNNNTPSKGSTSQKKEELEKLKLDLEIRKLDMERNKLEMEERQRREERDHQYRMMQLLLFGLGQQNTNSVIGHVTDQELGHVPNTTTLSRAIENGLLPGDSLRANEKGLSFSEI